MYKTKLCLGTSRSFGIRVEDQIALFKATGFEAFFTEYNDNVKKYRELADELGIIYQSIHAPFWDDKMRIFDMWNVGEEADRAVEELLKCVKDCADVNVPIMILHTYAGFGESEGPNEVGIENFRKVVEEAAKRNVKIAFENTEGEEYLAALMDAFVDYDNVGFCWDTGHELCYNRGKDMTALYGDRLIATHINDNLGIKDFNGNITNIDDLHLLPFDGINDWNSIAHRLNKCGFDDILTFELIKLSKPNRHENDKYSNMKLEEYVAEAYARACRLAALKSRDKDTFGV